MRPLSESFANDEVESELRDLMVELYNETLAEKDSEINVYGAPHLGPFSLVERWIAQDGLSVIRQNDEAALRYLFKAWRSRNPRRGTHFLAVYLRVLFGDFEIAQLHMPKLGEYPEGLKSELEITQAGESLDDYYLTSRLRVDLTADVVPERILRAMKSTVAARLILQVRVSKRSRMSVGTAQVFYGVNVGRASGYFRVRERGTKQVTGVGGSFGAGNVAYMIIPDRYVDPLTDPLRRFIDLVETDLSDRLSTDKDD